MSPQDWMTGQKIEIDIGMLNALNNKCRMSDELTDIYKEEAKVYRRFAYIALIVLLVMAGMIIWTTTEIDNLQVESRYWQNRATVTETNLLASGEALTNSLPEDITR